MSQGRDVIGTSGRLKALSAALGLVLVGLLLLGAGSASADIDFCSQGTGAGQCSGPAGIAVNPDSGDIYVADPGNNRIDVFDSSGTFQFAFGWGVADGEAELQSCTTTCLVGISGGGAGQFRSPARIAVDPAAPHDVYVFEQSRVQRFTVDGEFIATWGGGVITGGANGKGTLSSGSSTVADVTMTKRAFEAGLRIEGAGIPAGTKILTVGEGTLTLSKAATASGTGVALTTPAGAGNVPVNEVQELKAKSDPTAVEPRLLFVVETPGSSPSKVEKRIDFLPPPPANGPGGLQQQLEGFSNIGAGNVAVTGPAGGPYRVEFKGRLADTDVAQIQVLGVGNTESTYITVQNGGGSAEICTIAADCTAGIDGDGPGQFESAPGIAIGPDGKPYVAGNRRVQITEPSGAFVEEFDLAPGLQGPIAADSAGNFYVLSGPSSVKKFDSNGAPLHTIDLENPKALAVDFSTGDLFVAHSEGATRVIAQLDSSGNVLRRFGYGKINENMSGIALLSSASGDVLGTETFQHRVTYLSFPPPGPIACCLSSTPRNTSTVLKGGVNPEGKDTTYHLEYITQDDYVKNGNDFEGTNPATSTPESASLGSDFTLHGVEVQLGCAKVEVPAQPSCLKPSTEYHYRLIATNAEGEAEAEGTFTTLPPLDIEEVFATDVGTDAGRLHAIVNPLGIPASGYFEYVDDVSYQADLAEGGDHDGFAAATKVPDVDAGQAPISLGEGEAGKEVARELTLLDADTLYHYRFVASNPFVTVEGDANVFTTFPLPKEPTRICPNTEFRTAASAPLPECRAYEMVSPVDKNNNDIKVLPNQTEFPARLDQSSTDGNRFTYSSSTAFGDAVSAPWSSQYLATRQAGTGWSTRSLNTPQESVALTDQFTLKLDGSYKLFDSGLANGWLHHLAEPTLDECAPPGFINLYRRDIATGEYEALIPTEPVNIASADNGYRPELQGMSADGTRAVFRANTKLMPNAANGGLFQLYMHIADEGCGELRLISFRPNGVASTQQASAGVPGFPGEYHTSTVARAVSSDGSRVFFTLGSSSISGGALYVRVNADQEPSPVSGGKCTDISLGCTLEVSPILPPAAAPTFWSAAANGSRVLYSVGGSLFEFNVDKALAGEEPRTLIAGGFVNEGTSEGVAAVNSEATRIYFVSREEIDGEGEEGKRNLYLYEPDEGGPERYRLVATLGGAAGIRQWGFSVGSIEPIRSGARVTDDGSHLAFVSTSNPTGYDNADAKDGKLNLEVYLYDAEGDDLRCVSCNPSGARPRGREFGGLGDFVRVSAMMAPAETQFFTPRSLSADGNRLFFESFEALLPRDTNGKADVYEWQRASGEQACKEAGAELYVPSADGCLSLISSGQSPIDSEFADASPDGRDVFIRTASSLLPQDNGLVDVYDARMGGGLPQPPLPPAACEGEACQGPLNAPDDPTPASSAFEGAGNVSTEEKPASCRKPKVKRKGRCVAKKTRKASKAQKANKDKKAKANKKQKSRTGS